MLRLVNTIWGNFEVRNHKNLFLSTSDNEKYRLFVDIKRSRLAQASAADRILAAKEGTDLVTEVNLKQIAAITHKSYSSIYNTYNGLVPELEAIIHRRNTSVKRMFAVDEDTLFFHLVKKSHPYRFMMAILDEEFTSFEAFWKSEGSSKATMLRHLKPLRDFAKQFDISFSYEPMRLVGEERNLRLFFTVILWVATNGDVYPFDSPSEPDVHAAFDEALTIFNMPQPNPVTVRIGVFYLTVAFRRILAGHVLDGTGQSEFLHYPTPNLFKILEDKAFNMAGLNVLSIDQQMAETANLYFLFNFAPIHIISGTADIGSAIERYRRFNPDIFTLVSGFFEKLPFDFEHLLNMQPEDVEMLKANLMAVTLSTLVMGKDYTQIIEQSLNFRLRETPDNVILQSQIKQTLEYVVYSEQLTTIEPCLPTLINSYYHNANQLLYQRYPSNKIKVAPVVEQTVVGYIDLLAFLDSISFVDLIAPTDDLAEADVIVASAYASAQAYTDSHAITFPWRLDYTTDQFGQLYGVLRELWEQSSHPVQ